MKRTLVVAVLALLAPLLGPTAPAQAAGPDSWAHVWDADQTVSTTSDNTLKFPSGLDCPDNFHVKVSWIKWGYSNNYSVAGGCKEPFHLAGLKRHF